MSATHPTLPEIIRAAIQAHDADLHVSIPAEVVRVDLAKGQVDARPLVKDVLTAGDGARVALSVPVIANVPIVWPGAGGFRLTFPVAAGDSVLLVFSDRSLDAWLARGGEVDPGDPRRHALSDAVAIPGLRSFKDAWAGAAADGVTLGAEAGPWQPAALGQAVRDELDALWTALQGHTHPVPALGLVSASPGNPVTGAAVASSPTVTKVAQAVRSTTVKVSE